MKSYLLIPLFLIKKFKICFFSSSENLKNLAVSKYSSINIFSLLLIDFPVIKFLIF